MSINQRDLINITPYDLHDKLGINSPPYNPFTIAKSLGLEVDQTLDFDNINLSGLISNNNGKIYIWINPLDSDARQRFTLAHELGHYVNDILTANGPTKITDTPDTLYRNGRSNLCETTANKFAAKLLMPKDDIIGKAKELIDAAPNKTMPTSAFVSKMASIFEVSKGAMLVRLKTLGLVSEGVQI